MTHLKHRKTTELEVSLRCITVHGAIVAFLGSMALSCSRLLGYTSDTILLKILSDFRVNGEILPKTVPPDGNCIGVLNYEQS